MIWCSLWRNSHLPLRAELKQTKWPHSKSAYDFGSFIKAAAKGKNVLLHTSFEAQNSFVELLKDWYTMKTKERSDYH